MKKEQKKIQVFLFIVGVLLILITYFYYPYINKKKLLEENIVEGPEISSDDDTDEKTTSFENIRYEGLYDLNKTYTVTSQKAYIESEEPDIVYMTNMHVILYLSEGRVVDIVSAKGRYNKVTYDCFFEKNVKAYDHKTVILSENLDLLSTEDYASVYNNVILTSDNGSLKADKINYNFDTELYEISMFDDKAVKIKITK